MNKLILAALSLFLAFPAHASLEDDFRRQATEGALKPFARDIGGVLGAASVDPGRRLGFPGFEAGIATGIQFRPDRDNRILRASGASAFGVPLLYGAVGLPLGLDVAAHGVKVRGITVYGAGLRYSIFPLPVVGKAGPTAGLGFWADRATHETFDLTHYAFNASAGWALPLITPFVNAGLDVTKLQVTASNIPGVSGMKVWTQASRFGGGVDLTPLPFTRIRAAYQNLHGLPGATLDLLVKF
jgi:hypothetical protein